VNFGVQLGLRVWEKCAQHTKNTIHNASLGVLDRKELDVNFGVQLCLRVWEKCFQHTENRIDNASWGVLDRKELDEYFEVQLCPRVWEKSAGRRPRHQLLLPTSQTGVWESMRIRVGLGRCLAARLGQWSP